MRTAVNLAVFPVAGFGTRFLPATKATPKEMLPVVDKPLIQYAVEEAYQAGIRNMIFITGRNKWAITEHYDVAYELESELQRHNKAAFLQLVRAIKPKDMNIFYIRQERALGLGHAVLCAAPIVRDQPFAVLLADDLLTNYGGKPVLQQMLDVFAAKQCAVLGVMTVPPAETQRYGIITPVEESSAPLMTVRTIIEKPAPEAAPSRDAVIGRYILPGEIMPLLAQTAAGAGGEIQLTDAISALAKKQTVLGYRFTGKRYDCGDKLGYLQANVELGLQHPELGAAFHDYLQHLEDRK